MRMYSYVAGLIGATVCCSCLTDLAIGQDPFSSKKWSSNSSAGTSKNGSDSAGQNEGSRYSGNPRNGARTQQRSSTGVSTSRSVSFMENGRRVSIRENASGITVSVDGQSLRARNATELKKKSPEAYRMYKERIGAARARASGSASSGGSAGSSSSQSGSRGQSNSSSSKNRSISVMEDGKKVSITQNKSGITVTVDGQTVRAKDAAELKKRFPDAYRLYEKHLRNDAGEQKLDANQLLRGELNRMREENADNPRIRGLIEKMLENVGN